MDGLECLLDLDVEEVKKKQPTQFSTSVDVINGFVSDGSEKDFQQIERQLGYRPTNLCKVAARADDGHPTVLKLYPLKADLNAYKV